MLSPTHQWKTFFFYILLVPVSAPNKALAWGKTGHAVVADIAQAHLTPKAAAQVKRLLAVEGAHRLSDISSWADKAKAEGLPGSPSHTIRLPIDGSPAPEHPCPGHFCADDAIRKYGAILGDSKQSDADREIALKYIVHLVGDMQQPLHGVNATGQMKVIFDGKQMTLHAVWDDGIIDEHGGSSAEISTALIKVERGIPSGGDPVDWATEDRTIALESIYNQVPLHPSAVVQLPADYGVVHWPIVERRLTQGGLRLAQLLNELLK